MPTEFRNNENTLFPSLTGASPGDNPETGQSLDDNPVLPPLSAPRENFPDASDVSVAQADPGYSPQEQAPEAAPVADPASGQRKRSAESRIAQLTARYRTTQDTNAQLTSELHRIREQLTAMQANAHAPQSQRPSGNASPQAPDFLSAGVEGTAQAGRGVDLGSIEAAIARHVGPLADRINRTDAELQRKTAHERSWASAVADYPELAQPGEANEVFNHLYREHPLRLLPDAPEQIAVMVRGIVADSRREQAAAAVRKIGAAVHVPSVSPTDVLPRAQEERIGAVIQDSAARMRGGDKSFDTYRAMRLAAAARQRQQQR